VGSLAYVQTHVSAGLALLHCGGGFDVLDLATGPATSGSSRTSTRPQGAAPAARRPAGPDEPFRRALLPQRRAPAHPRVQRSPPPGDARTP
jgi:hypothetical protein